ncbi:glycoside hydrolase family 16 protein [Actinomadura rudentiformis]|uniref:Glycoside hydrolase family 16 protein n=1 Tax=Actinomadura rudentiformis TaxID=359158 RepID=A0A6H9YPI4_9ACTN|nr:glycoside hydrolase family 16 protein [Actinomadura rudentiformis]KAB2341904.1 glycoside hydrolase family 16 protein [Actinomadura rudentiformis]
MLNGITRFGVVGMCVLAVGTAAVQDADVPKRRDVKVTTPPETEPVPTAAGKYGWGEPVAADEFSGEALDPNGWLVYDGPGHAGQGRRSPTAVSVRNGTLTITGTRDGTTGGIAWRKGTQKYGRWEARVRSSKGCACYHPVLLLWPVGGGGGVAPKGGGGEVDYMETYDDGQRQSTGFYLHYGPEHGERKIGAKVRADLTRWHTFAVEWTPRNMSGFIDGRRWFFTANRRALPLGPMGQTIQLDWFPQDTRKTAAGIDRRAPATLEVDWIRMYTLRGQAAPTADPSAPAADPSAPAAGPSTPTAGPPTPTANAPTPVADPSVPVADPSAPAAVPSMPSAVPSTPGA